MIDSDSRPHPFGASLVNLLDPRLGAKALAASDEFFAPKERMLAPEPAIFVPGKYDAHGKWMDGWETRRKRGAGHDWCLCRLAHPAQLLGFDIDTRHFTGNFPPAAAIEAIFAEKQPGATAPWKTLIPASDLSGNAQHFFAVTDPGTYTHIRLNIYPDGGIARLRAYGLVAPDRSARDGRRINLAAIGEGARVIACSDAHYGSPMQMLYPKPARHMGEGWETRRRREPGHDWAIVALGRRGEIESVEIDTAHFKGNYPDRCSILAADVTGGSESSLATQSLFWRELLPERKLGPDCKQVFARDLAKLGPVTHLRLNMIPDGGIARLRVWGRGSHS